MKEGWNIKPLGDVGTFQRGGNFLKSDFVSSGYPCIHYGQIHMKFGAVTSNHLTCIPEALAISKAKIAKKGDLIIAITSEDVEGSCKSTAWMGNYDIAVGAHAAIYHHSLNPIYVSYYFQSPQFNKAKEAFTHGFKVVEIRPADIAKIPIAYPSPTEQQRIVDFLDAEFAKIDALKANAERNLQNAQDLFQAALKKELEPKEGWTISTIGDICDVQGGSTPRRTEPAYWKNGEYPWFTVDDIREQGRTITTTKQKITKLAWEKMRVFPANTVLLCCTASVGEYAITTIPLTSNQQFNGLTIKKNVSLLPMYLYYYAATLKSRLLELSGKATIDFVAASKVKSLSIAFPSSKEQQSMIVETLEALSKKCQILQDNYTQTLTLCDDLKQALLRKAFNGEL